MTDPAFTRAHEAFLNQGDFQTSFPSYVRPKEPEWSSGLGKFLQNYAPGIGWVLWAALGLLVLFALYHLIRAYGPTLKDWWRTPRDKPVKVEPQTAWRPTQAQARQLLAESDALAAQGHYAEAVHLLLLRSIEDIQQRRAGLVRPTLTSREIAMLRALPGPARDAFASIAGAVERGLFATRPIGAEDFARCRKEYEAFALPNWSQAA
jgi:uncharacterized protein DUF4129